MLSEARLISLCGMSYFYMIAGTLHMVPYMQRELYLKIMPPYLPFHLELVILSGVAEIVLGAALLFERVRRLAAWGIILMLIAIFPANIYMLTSGGAGLEVSTFSLWMRLPIQFLFMYWAYTFARRTYPKLVG